METSTRRYRLALASEVRALMARKRITNREVALAMGVTESKISNKLTGRSPFTTDEIGDLARALGVRPSHLFELVESHSLQEVAA